MTIHGCIEARIAQGMGANACNEVFVTVYNFLNNLASINVTRVAYSKGQSGTGMTYWDAASPPGNGAWALFKFGNATIPFYVLIQASNLTTATGFSYSSFADCTPCFTTGQSVNFTNGIYNVLSVAVAMHLNGTSPWNGTTNNNGSDTKGSPVWVPGSSSLAVFPRENAVWGDQATNRECMSPLVVSSTTGAADNSIPDAQSGLRMNIVVDENNIMFAFDGNANGSYGFTYFGKYVGKTNVSPQIPYVMLCNPITYSAPFVNGINYGAISGANTTFGGNYGDGGIVHPTASIGTKIVIADYSPLWESAQYNPSKIAPVNGRWDFINLNLCMNESPYFGQVGTVSFFKYVRNLETHAVTPDLKYAVFGTGLVQDTKIIMPWDGVTTPGTGINRVGVTF